MHRILRLINQLPQACRLNAAIATNLEHAEQIVEATGGQQSEYNPPLQDWHVQNDQLAAVNDRLDGLIATVIAVNGGTPKKTTPSPRPKTAFEEARMKVRKSRHKALVARVMRNRTQVD